MAAANSALVTSESRGWVTPMVSAASTRPSLPATAARKSSLEREMSSAGSRFRILLAIMVFLLFLCIRVYAAHWNGQPYMPPLQATAPLGI